MDRGAGAPAAGRRGARRPCRAAGRHVAPVRHGRAARWCWIAGRPPPPPPALQMSIQAPPNLAPEPDDAAGAANADTLAAGWRQLLDAGVSDWGSVSPITRDYVNPEKPWPHLRRLASATAAAGKALVPRLPVYPRYLQHQQLQVQGAQSGGAVQQPTWLDGAAGPASPLAAALRLADADGLARGSAWFAGALEEGRGTPSQEGIGGRDQQTAAAPAAGQQVSQREQRSSVPKVRLRSAERSWRVAVGVDGLLEGCAGPGHASPRVRQLLVGVLEQQRELGAAEIELLFAARGADFEAVRAAADELRRRMCGDTGERAAVCPQPQQRADAPPHAAAAPSSPFHPPAVAPPALPVTFVVNRNINYTNLCTFACSFCSFRWGKPLSAAGPPPPSPSWPTPPTRAPPPAAARAGPPRGCGTRRTCCRWRRCRAAPPRPGSAVPQKYACRWATARSCWASAHRTSALCAAQHPDRQPPTAASGAGLALPGPRQPPPPTRPPQGGIHPDFTGDTYLRLVGAAKRGAPDIHVHAFRRGRWRGAMLGLLGCGRGAVNAARTHTPTRLCAPHLPLPPRQPQPPGSAAGRFHAGLAAAPVPVGAEGCGAGQPAGHGGRGAARRRACRAVPRQAKHARVAGGGGNSARR